MERVKTSQVQYQPNSKTVACFRQAVINGQPLLLHGPIWQSPVGKPGTEPDPAQHGEWPLFLAHFPRTSSLILFHLNWVLWLNHGPIMVLQTGL